MTARSVPRPAPLAAIHFYRAVAPVYDSLAPLWSDWLYAEPRRAFDQALGSAGGYAAHFLDLGCGTGAVLERLLADGIGFASYTGVDRSPEMLAHASAKFDSLRDVRFQELDLDHDRLPIGPFDVIVSAWVLEHLLDPKTLVTAASQRLSPAGQLILLFEADIDSRRDRLVRPVWRFFGARPIPKDEYSRWLPPSSIRRFDAIGPSVVLASMARSHWLSPEPSGRQEMLGDEVPPIRSRQGDGTGFSGRAGRANAGR